jgi:GNAT superfamily N-acetyltransferase
VPNLGWKPGNFVTSVEEHLASIARGTLWVAADAETPIGFLTADIVDGELHIDELNTHLDHQRRGIGLMLMNAAVENARHRDLKALTLTTFREIPWNEPFYRSVGFRLLDGVEIGPKLQAMLDKEVEQGLPRAERCAMRKVLAG